MSKTKKTPLAQGSVLPSLGRLAAVSMLAALWMAGPLAAQDTPATLVVKNEVYRTYRVKVTPSNGGDPMTQTLQQNTRHTFTIPHGESCVDQTVEIEFRYIQGPVNRVDALGVYPLVAQEAPDANGYPACTLLVGPPTHKEESSYDHYLRWTKLAPSKGRVIFAVRYGI